MEIAIFLWKPGTVVLLQSYDYVPANALYICSSKRERISPEFKKWSKTKKDITLLKRRFWKRGSAAALDGQLGETWQYIRQANFYKE